jgi:hypothetical protein
MRALVAGLLTPAAQVAAAPMDGGGRRADYLPVRAKLARRPAEPLGGPALADQQSA